jgi:hypothetical protein
MSKREKGAILIVGLAWVLGIAYFCYERLY